MADVVLSTVDLDVFGGPTSLDVSVDFGQTGVRGSKIYSGPGDPDVFLVGQDIKLYDLYINTNTGEDLYSWMYQYQIQVGNPAWVPILQLNPSQHSVIATASFSTGTATINIPFADLTSVVSPSASDFIIRYNIAGSDPVASSFTYSIVGTNIVLIIEAVKYSGSSWSDLTGSQDVHLFISYKG